MRPLILDFIEQRAELPDQLAYHYSFEKSLNLIKIGDSEMPFIDLNSENFECATKTRVRVEQDDEPFSNLITATKVKNERDDLHNIVLELATKTLTKVERDDEDRNHY